jgi:hypothetical protein|tara:strand:- start:639 stop:959 length:321 start_codon:yes stop_codon:yes gene_type:complete
MAYTNNLEYIIRDPGVDTGNAGHVVYCTVRELIELFDTSVENITAAYNRDRWEDERVKRDKLIAETDFLALQDTATLTSEWETYRQALRDITDQADVDNITWPTKP